MSKKTLKKMREQEKKMVIGPDDVVKLLNHLLDIDRPSITNLFRHRVMANDKLADHPTVQVQAEDRFYTVSTLGIINGLLGVFSLPGSSYDKFGPIAAIYNDDGEISEFKLSSEAFFDVDGIERSSNNIDVGIECSVDNRRGVEEDE